MAEIDKLYGVGAEDIAKLKDAGINTIEEFYETAKHVDTRTELAEKTGIDSFQLESWSSTAGNFLFMMDCTWE